ncbi:M48 family metalloprotease [Bradyrhizobium sp. U87765 SZCCT0131]|uniref:M48 family metallopeptidase n=1 Tax=unclassified Bradyrhizobium TaxID=2631580 RepID=UPI001BA63920|nr:MULTISPECIES: M48 family metallopeptidase [unclassified Bradyrhizobium]MBR1218167.1 M48 family metalloprotease [Bradyrhizobium sp. U87765 SZCCT0131]MBR1260887.1 M48 family metalloprotease [Bradyrhizobium sp. U87765 SZCCT0134]MBR1303665.1 M48 family metalloprotease [Bradyrhizobium sp. U87765 SZCCT0110]MBR1319271.1 M48 family metalloprotease [Bradyrhizobium sp. U87765 SZCCT0109]MBR1347596.1 M48 family metalloprotease [Bradyrhizobium sp. U87765 SZCCT0048]
MAAYGLYTHIASNKFRSMLLLGGLFLLIYVMVFAGALIAEVIGYGGGTVDYYLAVATRDLVKALPLATLGSAAWIVIAYFFHQSIIDAVTGGRDVTRQEQPRLYNLLENLCISRGIPMPKLKIVDADALNAYATGLNRRQYSVTVTSGLLRALDDQEVEAVLGHELTHIRNGDVQLMVIAVVIAGVVGFFAELFFRLFFNSGFRIGGGRGSSSSSSSSDGDRKSGGGGAIIVIILAVALIALAWFLSLVVRFALSRSREYLADAGSVELTKNPDAMISALRKIENRGELPGATSAVMEMCVDNPRQGFADLFATHPSVESRVRKLVQFAGGHDPGPLALPPAETPDSPQQLPPGSPAPDPATSGAGGPAPGPWHNPGPPSNAPTGPWNKPAGPWGTA